MDRIITQANFEEMEAALALATDARNGAIETCKRKADQLEKARKDLREGETLLDEVKEIARQTNLRHSSTVERMVCDRADMIRAQNKLAKLKARGLWARITRAGE